MKKTAFIHIVRRGLLGLVMLSMTNLADGQTVRDAWLCMPDSLTSSLDGSRRKELLDYYDMKDQREVGNQLQGVSRLDSLTDSWLKATLSESLCLEMKVLPAVPLLYDGDSLICMIQTLRGPQSESRIRLFTNQWDEVSDTCFTSKLLLVKPDTMPDNVYVELLESIPIVLWSASLGADSNTLRLTPTLPLLFSEDKNRYQALLSQRNLNWNGKSFK